MDGNQKMRMPFSLDYLDCSVIFYFFLRPCLRLDSIRPHTLGAEDLYKAHLTPYLQEAQSALNNKLAATQAQNTELAQTIQAQRLEIEKLLSHVESVVTDVEGAATAATQFSKDNDLRQNAVQMDEEVNSRPGV